MSAESGIATFRGVDGLWEGHRVEEVASPEGFEANPSLVLEFYNQRRRQIVAAQPNEGHVVLARLEEVFDVHIITQNVDDLHELPHLDAQLVHLHPQELPLPCRHRFLLVVAAEDLPICRQVFLFCSLHLLFLDDRASVLEAVLEAGGEL